VRERRGVYRSGGPCGVGDQVSLYEKETGKTLVNQKQGLKASAGCASRRLGRSCGGPVFVI